MYVLDIVALGQQVALGHPHVTYDVLSGQRKDFVVIALCNSVSMTAANQFFREGTLFTLAVILTSIIKFGILGLDQFIWSSRIY